MATKKQSRPKVKGLVNPKGVTQVFGTPIDFKALPEKITIGRRVANGKFKLEAHYPAKHFNDKQTYIDKRKQGSYCRFYDKKSPFFIARTVWDATSQPGMHMITKNRGETHRFIVTPKLDDPTKASVIGSYLVHRDNGDPVLCSGVIGELEAVGDDGDFKVTPYQQHGIRCPKFDDQKRELAGHIPKTFEYKKSTKPRGPRKTAADYCKPSHTFKHPTDIKKAEMVADMDDEMDDAVSCLKCRWDGTYEDLVFVDADGTGGGGYDFMLACPVCEEDDWLDDMMAESVDEPCFACDGMGNHWDGSNWSESDCSYCEGSGLMSDTLRAEMAMFNNEYFDADCGCFKKAEGKVWGEKLIKGWSGSNLRKKKGAEHKTLTFMDWAKQEEASHLKKYGADTFEAPYAGAGALMGIKGDSALSSFTPSELTESSAIHGDFDQASLNYSGHQNLEVRAEEGMEGVGYPVKWEDVRKDMKYPKEDNNGGLIYGIEWVDDEEEIVDISWFATAAERDADLKKEKEWHINEYGAEDDKLSNGQKVLSAVYHQHPELYEKIEDYTNYPDEEEHDDYDYAVDVAEMVTVKEEIIDPEINNFNKTHSAEGEDLDCDLCGGTEEVGYVKDDLSLKVCEYCDIDGPDYDPKLWEAEYTRPTPWWAKPLGLIGGLAAGYISAQMIDNAKE